MPRANMTFSRITPEKWVELNTVPVTLEANHLYVINKPDSDILEVYITYLVDDEVVIKRLLNENDAMGISAGILLSTSEW